jgi:hypothetical protein
MTRSMTKSSWRLSALLGAGLAAVSLLPAGCDNEASPFVLSLQPYYMQTDLQADSRLNGTWSSEEGDVTFKFEQGTEKGKEKEYTLVVKEKDGEQEQSGEFDARVLRMGASLFLDIYPQNSRQGSEFYGAHFVRAHTIARLDVHDNSLQMAFLNAKWLKTSLEGNNLDPPCVGVDGVLLLTGTTEELQELVFSHSNDDEAFGDPVLFEKQSVENEQQ